MGSSHSYLMNMAATTTMHKLMDEHCFQVQIPDGAVAEALDHLAVAGTCAQAGWTKLDKEFKYDHLNFTLDVAEYSQEAGLQQLYVSHNLAHWVDPRTNICYQKAVAANIMQEVLSTKFLGMTGLGGGCIVGDYVTPKGAVTVDAGSKWGKQVLESFAQPGLMMI